MPNQTCTGDCDGGWKNVSGRGRPWPEVAEELGLTTPETEPKIPDGVHAPSGYPGRDGRIYMEGYLAGVTAHQAGMQAKVDEAELKFNDAWEWGEGLEAEHTALQALLVEYQARVDAAETKIEEQRCATCGADVNVVSIDKEHQRKGETND